MISRKGRGFVRFGAWFVGLMTAALLGADAPRTEPPTARRAVEPATPALPAVAVDAIQEGRYGDADRALKSLQEAEATPAADRPYFALIRAVAQRLDKRPDEARDTLVAALKAGPKGPWSAKLRAELAALELTAGRPAEAEPLARAEAEALLAGDRKDRLAEVYHAFARRLLKPDNPLTAADPEGAYALLAQARQLARGDDLRARLLLAMGRASQAANNHPRAIQDYQTYLSEYPKGADRFAVRFHLGEAQLAVGQGSQSARPTWADLVRDLEKVDSKEGQDFRARALYGIAQTYGIPAPGDDTSLNLGVAALRRLVRDHPAHPLAVRAAYEIGASYLARGKSQEAREALTAFLKAEAAPGETDDAKRERAELRMKATFEVAQILQGQEEFDDAIAAFQGYLAQFPDGPQSADAQRAILDTRLLQADDLRRREHYADARARWQAFAAQNPLDARVPQVLFQVGESFEAEKKLDEAIAAWEALAGKFPNTEPAAHAQYQVALTFETEKGDLPGAIERYRKVTVDPWRSKANQRIAVMEAKSLTVVTPRTFRSGETAHLKITTRNLETLTFTAYTLDPEAYFRKKHALGGVESLDIGLVAADAEWTAKVPGYARYKPIKSTYDLKIKVPGVWVVKVTDEKTLQATTLVLGSDLDAIVKSSRDQVLAFAQDMKTGKGRPGARVLFAEGKEILLEGKTGPDGVLLAPWAKPIAGNATLDYLILDGPDVAGAGLAIPDAVAQGLSPRAYLYTDRPAYRPGQNVSLRGVVREVKEGQYDNRPGAVYRLEVTDSRGRPFLNRSVKLSEFGTFRESLAIDEGAPVGTYHIRLYQPGKSEFAGEFEVQAYQLQKADLEFDLPKTVYFRGETIKATLIARYQYGTPLAGRAIAVQLPDGRQVNGTTDAAGKFPVEFPTEGFAEEQALELKAQLPQDGVSTVAHLMLAVRAFRIDLNTNRSVYLDGETFRLRVETLDALGKPTGQELSISFLKRIERAGRTTEREVSKREIKTDPATGRGTLSLTVDDADGGAYVVRASGTDRFGNPVVADRALTISGKADTTKLRLLADRTSFKVGEPAKVNLHNRVSSGPALLAWEADRILRYQIIDIQEGDNAIGWDVDGRQFPNFTLTAARMADARLNEARLDLHIERDLRVSIRPIKPTVGPGEDVEVEVTAADQLGRPVAAELSLALVDRALLRLHNDRLPPIGPFFYDQDRKGAFATRSTIAFHYAPMTKPVAEEVVEDAERQGVQAVAIPQAGRSPFGRLVPGVGSMRGSRIDIRSALDPKTRAVVAALELPIAMSFPNETPLEDVLKYLKDATRGADGNAIPIYVDPVGLQEAEQNLQAPVSIDLEGVPLRTTLQLLLKQIGMAYYVKDGLLTITSDTSETDEKEELAVGRGRGDSLHGYLPQRRARAEMGDTGGRLGSIKGGGIGGGAPEFAGMTVAKDGVFPSAPPAPKEAATPAAEPTDKPKGAAADRKRALVENLRLFQTDGNRNAAPTTAAAPARQAFVETAYWNPSVVTDKDGKARVTFKAPTALSEYRFTARGVTGAETLVGQGTADLAVRKDFFVDLKTPASLTQGDRPRFTAQVHHRGVVGRAEVQLSIYAGGRDQVDPRTIELKGDGVDEVAFDPFEVPEGESVRLTLTARVGDKADEMVVEVPTRPWGVQAFASASGTSADDATAFVGLPAGRAYESPEMLIVVSPTLRRMLIELALGGDAFPLPRRLATCILPIPPNTTADRAADLLAAASALSYLRATRAGDAPEAGRLADRARGLVSELITLQNEDGGWPWTPGEPNQARPSDRLGSSRAAWALAAAEPLGLLADPKGLDKAMTYLAQEFSKADVSDYETRATILHALSARGKASFEQANGLNRVRQNLNDVSLAYLALAYANMDRASLADEVLGVLGPRSKTESAGVGKRPRRYWDGAKQQPWHRNPVETTALAALAFAKGRPRATELAEAVDWLNAHRVGNGWQPHKAKGPALAALAAYYGRAEAAVDRYRLVVTVNDVEVYKADIAGRAEGRAIVVPHKAIKAAAANRVRFDIEGRGTFSYAVTLTGFTRDFGPDQDRANRPFIVDRRVYEPAAPELDGKPLPTGFGVAINPRTFENRITQLALGGRARVRIDAYRAVLQNQPTWEQDFLILEEHLPAGTTLVEGSLQSQASHHELNDGVLTLYFAPDQYPGGVQYEVYGYLPGRYRALPPRLRSAYEPGRQHLGKPGELTVLAPGEASTDPYRPTPDELYARGKGLYDAGKLAEAAGPLEALWGGYTLRDDVAKDAARMLLFVHIKDYQPRKIVQYFEILKEKAPDLVIPFDAILVVGRAYRDLGEHERAYLIWRAIADASYLEDARIGEALRQRGESLESVAFLLDLWREYPDSAPISSDFFGLSQVLARLAGQADSDPNVRKDLAAANVSRDDLLRQAIRLADAFLARDPKNPLADEVSLALVGDYLEREDFEAVVTLSRRFAERFPDSTFLDSFQYSEALGRFHLGQYDRAIEVADRIAKATYKDPAGAEQPSTNKWQAIYILGQIYDARRQAGKALAFYEQVADRFTDAAGAIKSLKREDLKLPEVSIVRPPGKAAKAADRPSITLTYRNIAEADVKVYPVDLMRLYLTRRNLDAIAGIDLAGITPLVETTVSLGDGADYEEKTKSIALPLEKEGAYLVMVRGDTLYASGIVLVTPLELEALEDVDGGRVRITVRDASTKDFVPKVQVKVIGSANPVFQSGETDLRGVFVAEGLRGQVTAVARLGAHRYAFYRGTQSLGPPPAPTFQAGETAGQPGQPVQLGRDESPSQALDMNLKTLNTTNQARQIDRLQQRHGQGGMGGGMGVPVGGVR